MRIHHRTGIFFGLVCIFFGLGCLSAFALNLPVRWWGEGAVALVIAAFGVYSLFSRGIRLWNLALLGVSAYLLLRRWNFSYWGPKSNMYYCLIGLIVLIYGISRLFRRTHPWPNSMPSAWTPPASTEPEVSPPSVQDAPRDTSETFFARTCLFSPEQVRPSSKNLQGGRGLAIFGDLLIDLREADFTQPIELSLCSVFGNITVLTPPTVLLEFRGNVVFGRCDSQAITGRSYDPTHPPLRIRYTSLFGLISIQ